MKDVLKAIPLFSGLSPFELERISDITTKRTYKKRSHIFMEGEPREAVFFIKSGVIKAYKVDTEGNEQVISFLQKNDMFPHVGFFDNAPYPATTEVIQDAELLVIRIEDFDELLISYPQIAVKVMKIMGKRMLQLQQRVQELISGDVFHRVIRALLRLAAEYGEEREDGIFIYMPVTNQDFANMVGTSRETINRTLNQLKKEHLLDINRQGILIYDLEALREAK